MEPDGENIKPFRHYHSFFQGGAGVILSRVLILTVAEELENCNKRFNDPDFAGSMKFAICMERIVGADNWSEGNYIHPWSEALHSLQLKEKIAMGFVNEAPASFHRLNKSDFIWAADREFVWWDYKGGSFCADLRLIPFVEKKVPFSIGGLTADWRVGADVSLPLDQGTQKSKGRWKDILGENGNIIAAEQKYRKGINMRLMFDGAMTEDLIYPLGASGKDSTYVYLTRAPEIRRLK